MMMKDPENLVVSCNGPKQAIGAINALMPELPSDIREQLNTIKLRYWQRFGFDGLYERVNNRTIKQILAEYIAGHDPKVIASGQVDDVSYELYDRMDSVEDDNG
jgi:hypothetical protein